MNHSFFACLSFTHALSGMNHIPVASPLPPATVSKQKQKPTKQLPVLVTQVIFPPQWMWVTTCSIYRAHMLAGYHKVFHSILPLLTCEMPLLLPIPPGTQLKIKVSNPGYGAITQMQSSLSLFLSSENITLTCKAIFYTGQHTSMNCNKWVTTVATVPIGIYANM